MQKSWERFSLPPVTVGTYQWRMPKEICFCCCGADSGRPTMASAPGFGFSVGAGNDGYHDRGEYREDRDGLMSPASTIAAGTVVGTAMIIVIAKA